MVWERGLEKAREAETHSCFWPSPCRQLSARTQSAVRHGDASHANQRSGPPHKHTFSQSVLICRAATLVIAGIDPKFKKKKKKKKKVASRPRPLWRKPGAVRTGFRLARANDNQACPAGIPSLLVGHSTASPLLLAMCHGHPHCYSCGHQSMEWHHCPSAVMNLETGYETPCPNITFAASQPSLLAARSWSLG